MMSSINSVKKQSKSYYQTCIIGAGFGGLISALELKKNGLNDFIIVERESKVGGTWNYNTYPGCACDVPSHLYSIKSEPSFTWKNKFGRQEEILEYIKHCYEKNELTKKTIFNSSVKTATFSAETGLWQLELSNQHIIQSRFVISATGPLNEPKIPLIKNISTFTGKHFHSMKWDHSIDFKNKNVVVIGTGASSIQFIPQLANEARNLHIIQRTAPWVLPKLDKKYSRTEAKLYENFPFLQGISRKLYFYFRELFLFGFLGKNSILRILKKYSKSFLEREIKDHELRNKLRPNFELGCKRILLSNDYYSSLNRDNVHLETAGIVQIENDHLVLENNSKIPVDVIIYGTGFRPSSAVAKIRTFGLNNLSLVRTWLRNGPKTYQGVISHGFPNMFFIVGPNTGLANNSILLMMEAQTQFIINYINFVISNSLSFLEVKKKAQEKYNTEIQHKISSTIWNQGNCRSWYLDSKGNNWALWPGFIRSYQKMTKKLIIKDFNQIPFDREIG